MVPCHVDPYISLFTSLCLRLYFLAMLIHARHHLLVEHIVTVAID